MGFGEVFQQTTPSGFMNTGTLDEMDNYSQADYSRRLMIKEKLAKSIITFLNFILKMDMLLPGGLGVGPKMPDEMYKKLAKEFFNRDVELENKIEKAIDSIQKSSNLISELEEILNKKSKKLLQEIKIEIEKQAKISEDYQKLVEINRFGAEPILNSIKSTVDEGKSSERVINIVISVVSGAVFFLLGIYWKGIIIFLKYFFGLVMGVSHII